MVNFSCIQRLLTSGSALPRAQLGFARPVHPKNNKAEVKARSRLTTDHQTKEERASAFFKTQYVQHEHKYDDPHAKTG